MNQNEPFPIILDDLIHAIEDHCNYNCYYLDRETGDIVFQSEHYFADDEEDDSASENNVGDEEKPERFIPIEPMESRRGIEIMREFIDSLAECAAGHDLSRALSKRKPFRHFKDALHNYPDMEHRWHQFQDGEIQRIAEEWLQYYAINYEFVSLKDMLK